MPAAEPEPADQIPGGPLADAELSRLFAPLARAKRIALAVSGGADSLALLDAVDRWRRKRRGPEVVVLTVDHRLRKGTGREAATVRAIAKARGLSARVLVRTGPRPAADIEAAARTARYRLLFDACREIGASHLVVAHHRDDVAETFLMRLKRGAGIFGLAAMRPRIGVGDLTLVRPFLAVPRARLRATAEAAGWTPVDDPMNDDPRLARTLVRRQLAGGKLDPAVLAATAARFADLADTIDAAASALIARAVTTDAFAIAWLNRAAFAAAPEEIARRALVRMLIAVGGEGYPPRFARLTALHAAMRTSHPETRFKRTLAGVVIEGRGKGFAVFRELGRDGLARMRLRPGIEAVFDHRFRIRTPAGITGLSVAALGEEGRRSLKAAHGGAWPAVPPAALAALPAVRRGRKIVAVPHFLMGARGGGITFQSLLDARLKRPPLFPDFA